MNRQNKLERLFRRSRAVRVANPPINPPINSPVNSPINYPITRLPDYPIGGFTIIELLVVLALISILATIGMAQYQRGVAYAQEAVLKEDLFLLRDALDQYYADKGQYPGSLDALVAEGYIRRVPVDPITNAADWQIIFSEPDPNNPTAIPGVMDVRSASERTSLNGERYADW